MNHQSPKTARTDAQILSLMSDGRDWTITTLAATLTVSNERVRLSIRRLVNAHQIYHSRRIEPSHTNAYRIIDTDNPAPVDPAVVPLEDDPEHEAKLDRRHRRHTPSWPAADQTLVTAMFAMVQTTSAPADDN
ncbi:hypothetical protein KEH57_09460 [Burkholderia cenocepacia]|uniref:hypothetical protein n=1 Tax=Burkholderia cenocepacia TaxID=95486 RepID=UPI001BA4EE58|nr:hypothetical protein [Burkholderia cenocepacia]QUO23818.1 hypothetical protein KEH57_09460 [Burkholderia cenocepacia]